MSELSVEDACRAGWARRPPAATGEDERRPRRRKTASGVVPPARRRPPRSGPSAGKILRPTREKLDPGMGFLSRGATAGPATCAGRTGGSSPFFASSSTRALRLRPSASCRYGQFRFTRIRKDPSAVGSLNGRLPCTLRPPPQAPEIPSLARGIGAASRGAGAEARRANLRGPGSFASGSQYPLWNFTHYFCTGGRPFRTAHDLAAGAPGSRRHGPIALHCRRAVRPSAAAARRPTASAIRVVAVHRPPATRPPTTGWLPLALNAHDSTRA